MVKKYLLLAFLCLFFTSSYAQKGEVYEDDIPSLYGLHGELGYGGAGLGVGFGFRYEFISVSMGVAGFANSIPNYALSYHDPSINLRLPNPLDDKFDEEKYESILVTFDAAYNHEFDWGNIYAGVGFFAQTDSILAKERETGSYYIRGTENTSGICFNLGADYYWSEHLGVGLGFHSKKGIMARFSYYWW